MSDPFLQHILCLVSTFESDVKTSTAPLVWDGVHTDQTIAILDAINALGVRCREAEANLDTIRREYRDTSASYNPHSGSFNDHTANAVTDISNEEGAPIGIPSAPENARDIDPNSSFDIAAPKNNLRPADVSAVEEVKLLKAQVHDITRICSAIVRGDLSQKVQVEAEGEMLALKCTQIYPSVPDFWVSGSEVNRDATSDTVNNLVDWLSHIISKVRSVLLQMGQDGIFGGDFWFNDQFEGCWSSLLDDVNLHVMNLTNQLRHITGALVKLTMGDFTSELNFPEMRGEMLELKWLVIELTKWMSAEALMESLK